MDLTRPLFVPLRTAEFEAFERGAKTVEFRRLGPQYNERTCPPGRAVTLSLGYSGRRLSATIVAVAIERASQDRGLDTYGPDATVIAITLTVTERGPQPPPYLVNRPTASSC